MIYYAHSLRKYNTPEEKAEIKAIRNEFKWCRIYNPNNRTLQAIGSGIRTMDKCYEIIRSGKIHALIFSEYLGYIGKGVYNEVLMAIGNDKPIYIIRNNQVHQLHRYDLDIVNPDDWKVRYAMVTIKS